MRSKINKLLAFLLICIILSTTPVFANSLLQSIDVIVNNIKLFVNDKQITEDNFVYKNTTYVPIRAVAESLGLKVNWDSSSNKVDLQKASIILNKNNDGKYKIYENYMESGIYDTYFLWGFLDIAFDKNIKPIDNSFKAYVTDMYGNEIETRCQRGNTLFNNLLVVPKAKLELNTYYNLYIPKNTVVMENGDLYKEEILFQIKTPANVLLGKISCDTNLFGKDITLKNPDIEHTAMIKGENEFIFTDLAPGDYDVIINNVIYGKIKVEANKINNATVYFSQK